MREFIEGVSVGAGAVVAAAFACLVILLAWGATK